MKVIPSALNILFLCGSLEPGHDGVGDYTRRLAGEMVRNGYSLVIASLNESKLESETREFQLDGNVKVPVFRIPSKFSNKKRFTLLKGLIDNFSPNLISLQYVPYSFSKHGIPITLGFLLSKLPSNNFWHVMVHEPYLGSDAIGWKDKIIKCLQIFSLRQLKMKVKPILFHTSNPAYQKRLKRINIDSKILGLFGNIEIIETSARDLVEKAVRKTHLTGIYFGSAPKREHHEVFANEIRNYLIAKAVKLQLIFCGKSGVLGEIFMTTIKKACNGLELDIKFLGTQSVEALSLLFISSDFGISRIPPIFLGKSGSVIAMLEHGLPVWVPLGKGQVIEDNLDFRPEICFQDLSELGSSVFKSTPYNRIPLIAKRYICDIGEIVNIEAKHDH